MDLIYFCLILAFVTTLYLTVFRINRVKATRPTEGNAVASKAKITMFSFPSDLVGVVANVWAACGVASLALPFALSETYNRLV
jgi:hypothetical protein